MIEISELRKRFAGGPDAPDGKLALDGISFFVRPGEMFGFVGANGAGKTTTMRIVMGVLQADSGSVSRQGRQLGYDDRRRFGYMPEERGLYQKMWVAEQIEYFGPPARDERRGRQEGHRGPYEAAGCGRAQERPGAGALAGQPAARAAGARPRGAGAGRAVLRARPDRGGRAGRRSAGAVHVEHFGHEQPTLTEIFKEAVA
ncbi:ABC-type lipoprotein export system ATPase subunit [Nonomuraea muscovyensis]|uniref:ABC-type lipoprotein export system ATPase subunit n=1 Tax=Nonomuraea muscovyensis TaxID=1124761 RepID=A0A7X0EWQ5_9ACTN|nr:ATP-binding cassette domain-containing protein [Nonomuraea muscovyensis]MBB6346803.1 ABC-type lipoprotein export system ATPase subunit [Nonomuraea muscovyensis]